jgi:hypothetical protein
MLVVENIFTLVLIFVMKKKGQKVRVKTLVPSKSGVKT